MENDRIDKVLEYLGSRGLEYTWYTHPEAPTIEIARQYWKQDGSKHCKNLFFVTIRGTVTILLSLIVNVTWIYMTLRNVCIKGNSPLLLRRGWRDTLDLLPVRYRRSAL